MAIIEEWVDEMNVPPGVLAHFAPVRDLLSWIQVSPPLHLLGSCTDQAPVSILYHRFSGARGGNTVAQGHESIAGMSSVC